MFWKRPKTPLRNIKIDPWVSPGHLFDSQNSVQVKNVFSNISIISVDKRGAVQGMTESDMHNPEHH